VVGNRNLAEAAKGSGVRRFVFTGILNSHQTPAVPHFWHKKLTEDRLEELGVPFVSLRPGAFLDQMTPVLGRGLPKGRLWYAGSREVRMSYVLSGDVARYLAEAVDAPGIEGERIDIGWEGPVSANDLARFTGGVLGREVRVRSVPWWVLNFVLGVAGRLSGQAADLHAMVGYFQSGRYVADPERQREVFGAVPTAEEGVRRWLEGAGLAPGRPGTVVSGAGSRG